MAKKPERLTDQDATPPTFPRHVAGDLITAAKLCLEAAEQREDAAPLVIMSKVQEAEKWLSRVREHFNPKPEKLDRKQSEFSAGLAEFMYKLDSSPAALIIRRLLRGNAGLGTWNAWIQVMCSEPFNEKNISRLIATAEDAATEQARFGDLHEKTMANALEIWATTEKIFDAMEWLNPKKRP